MNVDNVKLPLYRQVFLDLQAQIRTGRYRPGDRLPSESQISTDFGVSKITTRRALQELENEALVERRSGVGTIVSAPMRRVHSEGNLEVFLENLVIQALSQEYEILSFGRTLLPQTTLDALGIKEASRGLAVTAVATREGKRAYHMTTYVPDPYGRGIKKNDITRVSVLVHLIQKGLRIGVVDQALEAIRVPKEVQAALRVDAHHPMMQNRLAVYDTFGRPAAFVDAYLRGDVVVYRAHFARGNHRTSAAGV